MKIRTALLKLHLWVGVATAVFIVILSVTGILIVFTPMYDRAMHPDLLTVAPGTGSLPIDSLIAVSRQEGTPAVAIVPRDKDESFQVFVMNAEKKPTLVYLNQYTGQLLGARTVAAQQQTFLLKARAFHRNLLQGKNGSKVVGIVTILSVFMGITGLVLWWQRKIVRIRTTSYARFNFDLHSTVGILSSVMFLVVALTGIVISYSAVGRLFDQKAIAEPEYPAPAGMAPLSLDSLAKIAQGTIPGSAPAAISIPKAKSAVINMGLRQPGEAGNATRSRIWIDRFTGKVLRVDNAGDPSPGQNGTNMHLTIAMLHTGVLLGWVTATFVLIGAIGPLILVITGLTIWLRRLFRPGREPAL